MKAIVFNEELLKRLTGSDKVKVLTEKRHNELLEKIDNLEKKLTKSVQKMHILEKQLAIAVNALEDYADKQMWIDEDLYYSCAEDALKQIKELDK